MKGRLRRKTGEELNIMDLRILKYPNVTNLLSNAPFHEIKNIYSKLYNGIIMAKRIKDDNEKYFPSLNGETNAVEEITLIEIE